MICDKNFKLKVLRLKGLRTETVSLAFSALVSACLHFVFA